MWDEGGDERLPCQWDTSHFTPVSFRFLSAVCFIFSHTRLKVIIQFNWSNSICFYCLSHHQFSQGNSELASLLSIQTKEVRSQKSWSPLQVVLWLYHYLVWLVVSSWPVSFVNFYDESDSDANDTKDIYKWLVVVVVVSREKERERDSHPKIKSVIFFSPLLYAS